MKVRVERTGSLFSATAIEAIIGEEIKGYLTETSKRLERAIAEKMPVNTGVSRGALFSEVRGISQGRGDAIVSLPVEHAEALEMGSKPHWPPMAPIELWVRQRFRDKGGSINAAVRETRRSGSRATFGTRQDRAIRSIAFLVARKIARSGTKALRMFARSTAELQMVIDAKWQATVDTIAKRLSE